MIRGSSLRTVKQLSARRLISTKTQYTNLSNGLTIATESNPAATTNTVGLWVGSGSRSEHRYSNGVAKLLQHVFVKSNESKALSEGILLSAKVTKETSGIYAQTTKATTSKAVSLIAKIVSTPSFDSAVINQQKAILAAEAEAFEEKPEAMVYEHLHSTAFQGTPLALPVNGIPEVISTLESMDLEAFYKKNYLGSNAVFVVTGDVNHNEVVDALEKEIKLASGIKPTTKASSFLGSEVRMRDDTLPKGYFAIAAKGEALDSPNYYVAKVASGVNGNFVYNDEFSKFAGSKLSSIVRDYHVIDKYTHFSTSYSDSGLWGFVGEASNVHQIDDAVHFTLKEWNRLSVSVTEAEIARAKAFTKATLLNQLSGSNAIAFDIAEKTLSLGYRPSTDEALAKIDKVTVKDVKAWASDALWDKDVAIAATGQIESLLDYDRIRNDMSMMRW